MAFALRARIQDEVGENSVRAPLCTTRTAVEFATAQFLPSLRNDERTVRWVEATGGIDE